MLRFSFSLNHHPPPYVNVNMCSLQHQRFVCQTTWCRRSAARTRPQQPAAESVRPPVCRRTSANVVVSVNERDRYTETTLESWAESCSRSRANPHRHLCRNVWTKPSTLPQTTAVRARVLCVQSVCKMNTVKTLGREMFEIRWTASSLSVCIYDYKYEVERALKKNV